MTTIYPTDLTDAEWEHLAPYLPARRARGRPCSHPPRAILDAVFSLLRTGCPWRCLPRDFPPWQTVYSHFRRLRLDGTWHRVLAALRAAERQRAGRDPEPTAAIMDAQSVKTAGESARDSGFDAHKRVKGRKRHLSVYVTAADVHDQVGARGLLAGLAPLVPRLARIWADGSYAGAPLATWCGATGGWSLEIVERATGARGFNVLPRRWVVERTFAWLVRNRRLRVDYERRVQTSEAFIQVAAIRLLLRRLTRST